MPIEIPRELDRALAVSIIGIARTDAKFPANVIDNAESEAALCQLAADVAHTCRAGGWQKIVNFETRSRILAEYDQHTRVEPEPYDPLAENVARNVSPFDPWQREAAINEAEYVAVIGEPVDNQIAADGTGSLNLGGHR